MSCLRAAFHDWQCLSGVHMVLGDSIWSGNLRASNDNLNIVQFGTDSLPTTLARASQWSSFSPYCKLELVKEIDIIVNRAFINNFYCDTACGILPYNKSDLYATLLHELGHAHSLNHINDSLPNRVMWYGGKPGILGGTPAPDRSIYLLYDLSSKQGADYVSLRAKDSIIPNICGYNLIQPLIMTDCDTNITPYRMTTTGCIPNGFNELNKQNIQLLCYPNPTESKLNIEFNLSDASDITIKIFDNFGREVDNSSKIKLGWGKQTSIINTSKFISGIYLLQVTINNNSYSTKFIKQ